MSKYTFRIIAAAGSRYGNDTLSQNTQKIYTKNTHFDASPVHTGSMCMNRA
jgi:hypothetical protein